MFVPGLIAGSFSCWIARLRTDHAELGGGNRHGRGAKKAAAMLVDLILTLRECKAWSLLK